MVAYMELQKQLTNLIKDINRIILHNENDEYRTKKHLIDNIDNCFDDWIKKYNLSLEEDDSVEMDEEALKIIKGVFGIKTKTKGKVGVKNERSERKS